MRCRGGVSPDVRAGAADSLLVHVYAKARACDLRDSIPLLPSGNILVVVALSLLHLHSSLLPLYVPLLDNSVMTLMLFDEIKSFTFITSMSLQELYLFA